MEDILDKGISNGDKTFIYVKLLYCDTIDHIQINNKILYSNT